MENRGKKHSCISIPSEFLQISRRSVFSQSWRKYDAYINWRKANKVVKKSIKSTLLKRSSKIKKIKYIFYIKEVMQKLKLIPFTSSFLPSSSISKSYNVIYL